MKKFWIVILIGIMFANCNTKKTDGQSDNDSLIVSYHFSSEVIYEDMVLNGSKLIYKHLNKDFKCPDNYVVQAPCYSEKDLVSEEIELKSTDIGELAEIIETSEFLKLKGNYGGASDVQRFYPCHLKVKLNDKESDVIYQSFPKAKPMPEAFKKVQAKLLSLVNQRN
jgi:hypothetical protein